MSSQIPVGSVQVMVPPTKPKTENASMCQLKHFSSLENEKKEQRSKIVNIVNKVDFELQPNKSCIAVIDYRHQYENLPFVCYSLICHDDSFYLSSHLKEITTSTFTVMVNNKLNQTRKVSIYYRILQV